MRLALANTPRDKGRSLARLREEAAEAERRGDTARAIEVLEDVVRQAPDELSLRRLAGLLERVGRVREANGHYRRLAESYEHSYHHARAIAAWKRVAQNEPGFAGAHVKLGELYASRGLRADARQHYQSALVIYRGTSRMREAEQIEHRVAELEELSNPKLPAPEAETGSAGGASSAAPAGDASGRGQDVPSSDDVEFVRERLDQARLFRRFGLLDQARQQLDALLARDPAHVAARRELRDLLEEAGQEGPAAEQQRVLDGLEGAAPPTETAEGGEVDALGDLVGLSTVLGNLEEPAEPLASTAPAASDDALEELELVPVDETPSPAPEAHLAIELDDFSHTLREFRAQVNERLGEDDETRYDLGIAYREMGLLDEAIAELQLASRLEHRFVECVTLLAACFVDKGLPQLAVRWLERGLAREGLASLQAQSLRYDLAAVLESTGEPDRARELYTEIYGEDAGFRDVASRLRALGDGEEPRGVVLPWRSR